MNYEKETIKWMTGKVKYKASFGEFVDVCQLDYHTMKEGMQMDKLPKVKRNEAAQLYVTSNFEYGKVKDLAMEPSLLNSSFAVLCCPRSVIPVLSDQSTMWQSRAFWMASR